MSPLQQQRLTTLIRIFALLTLVIILRLGYLATAHADRRAQLRLHSCHDKEFIIPGCRGDIYAADGTLIASSQGKLNIVWEVPQTFVQAEIDRVHLENKTILKDILPPMQDIEAHLGESILLSGNFDVQNNDAWEAVLSFYPSLVPQVTYSRSIVNLAGLTPETIGTTVTDPGNGLEIGISGLEARYDSKLRAGFTRCQYLSRHQRFILEKQTNNGKDVTLIPIHTSGGK